MVKMIVYVVKKGKYFKIMGRVKDTEVRGCSDVRKSICFSKN